jgi:hypothetical protein
MTSDRNGAAPLPSRGVTAPPSVSIALPVGDYIGVARLVAAGFATRLDLRYEAVDDLQTAIETVLRTAFGPDDHATVAISSDARSLSVSIGPVAPGALKRRFHEHDAVDGMDLNGLLGRLVDDVTVESEPISSIVLHVDLAAGAV